MIPQMKYIHHASGCASFARSHFEAIPKPTIARIALTA